MGAKYITVANVRFGEGNLVVQQEEFVGTDAYEDGKVPEPRYGRFLKYCDKRGETLLEGLKDIKRLAEYLNLDLTAQVAQHPADYAALFSSYLRFGVVVAPTSRFEYLRSDYGICLENHTPYLEKGTLCCLIFAASLETAQPPLWDVRWQLVDMNCHKKRIRPLQKR